MSDNQQYEAGQAPWQKIARGSDKLAVFILDSEVGEFYPYSGDRIPYNGTSIPEDKIGSKHPDTTQWGVILIAENREKIAAYCLSIRNRLRVAGDDNFIHPMNWVNDGSPPLRVLKDSGCIAAHFFDLFSQFLLFSNGNKKSLSVSPSIAYVKYEQCTNNLITITLPNVEDQGYIRKECEHG